MERHEALAKTLGPHAQEVINGCIEAVLTERLASYESRLRSLEDQGQFLSAKLNTLETQAREANERFDYNITRRNIIAFMGELGMLREDER